MALEAGAYVDYDEEPLCIDGEFYERFLSPLPQILEISTEEFGYEIHSVFIAMQKRLLSRIKSDLPEVMSEVFFDPHEGRRSLIQRLESPFLENHQERLNFRNPEKIGRRAFETIRKSPRNMFSLPTVVRGLALIGWTSKYVRDRRKCLFCPAQTDLETKGKYCHRHSQSDPNTEDRTASRLYMQYRVGKKARQLADELGIQTQPKTKSILSEPSHLRTMMDVLVPIEMSEGLDGSAKLESTQKYLLEHCPRVLHKLGGQSILQLKYEELGEKIREVLNPYRFKLDHLQSHIQSFEEWFSLEELVQPGIRGAGKKMRSRVSKAAELATAGYRQVEIAKIMGVQESTVSNWARKYKNHGM
ncbi:helix-turn-helix domain-containing protein [Oxalicibacterium faecigallinarum]|nr:helix-turn-helix domain-containing protein [Oxalicibacterium faecigallinarum]